LVGLIAATFAVSALGCEADKPAPPAAQPSAKPTLAPPPPPAPAATSAAPPPEAKPKRKKEDCPKGPTVTIDNPALEAQIRLKLQKADGPITAADLHKLRSLNAASVKLDDLDVCVFSQLTGLKELFLGPGDYDDLSSISGATGLETLRASLSKVHDLTPLSKMPKLDRLDLGHTQVNDLKPIAGATALTELVLDEAPVEDLSPLAKFTALETLSIKNTHVKDVSPLNGLKKLKALYVMGAPVEEDPSAFATLRAHGTRVSTQ
jgi:internalin A